MIDRDGTKGPGIEGAGCKGSYAAPRIRAGAQQCGSPARSWIHDQAPRLRAAAQERRRREAVWAWLSVLTLIVSWDAATRLDEHMSPPRPGIAYANDADIAHLGNGALPGELIRRR